MEGVAEGPGGDGGKKGDEGDGKDIGLRRDKKSELYSFLRKGERTELPNGRAARREGGEEPEEEEKEVHGSDAFEEKGCRGIAEQQKKKGQTEQGEKGFEACDGDAEKREGEREQKAQARVNGVYVAFLR